MSAGAELLAALDGRGVKLWLHDGRLRYRAPSVVDHQALRVVLTKCKAELVVALRDREQAHLSGRNRCVRCGAVDLGKPSALCGWCQGALAPGWWSRHGADSSRGIIAAPIEDAPVTRVMSHCASCGGGKAPGEAVCRTCRAVRGKFPPAGIFHSEPLLAGAST